ncbi:MAG: hypothetical protein HOD11_09740 [Candidatus Marinimicrobia bacterium]|nr:hypothetical protein [Candidatus Neomarinimicrobiota bacterium]
MKNIIQHQWVLHDGTPTPVQIFKNQNIPRGKRPRVLCPNCEEEVTLHLGEIRAPHFSHQSGSICNESALHLNTKMHLATELSKTDKFFINMECLGRCGKIKEIVIFQKWDKVKTEKFVQDIKPDITLYEGDNPIGSFEIVVTSDVTQPKDEVFESLKLDYVRIPGNEFLYRGEDKWIAGSPFPVEYLYLNRIEKYRCKECSVIHEKQLIPIRKKLAADRELLQKDLEQDQKKLDREMEYRSKNYQEASAVSCFDIYYESGSMVREVYYSNIKVVNGKRSRKYIVDSKDRVIVNLPYDTPNPIIQKTFKKYLKRRNFKSSVFKIDWRIKWRKPNQQCREEHMYDFIFTSHTLPKFFYVQDEQKWIEERWVTLSNPGQSTFEITRDDTKSVN